MKSDSQLKTDIVEELTWDPEVTMPASQVGVIVKDGVVTLMGHPPSLAEKHAIERAAQRVDGVKALAVEMEVKLAAGYERTDADIAQAAERALEWNVLVPDGKIKVMVENGHVTLTGQTEWEYQRQAAYVAVHSLLGVVGVTNQVVVKPKVKTADIATKIEQALERQATRDARHIQIIVNNGEVTLSGKVHSWAERRAAQGAAWSAPGVANVVNHLLVQG
ncbi:BON domain-containing protein [Variovorax sp. J22R133]|uniref:BON domain-containing protein n=1 Tax=Variovorax brevis TaxID=3053503 RepID=UPI0025783097|nr:BON domain-containing protein [Variovorax sp. J22R133]MDM0116355.1 BON domain-containing protein [Variovorax sp. J22R133]